MLIDKMYRICKKFYKIETRIYYDLEIELNGNLPVPSLVELTIGTQPVTTMS